jgi:hypothetical protein
MPRQCPIAHLSVRNPGRFPFSTSITAGWLAQQAQLIESSDLTDSGRYVARRLLGDVSEGVTRAKLRVVAPGALSKATRKRVAKWLRSRADYLARHGDVAAVGPGGWFTQVFSL